MKKVFLVISVLIFLSCDSTPVENLEGIIDPDLYGVWYKEITDTSSEGPQKFIQGIEIAEDGTVYDLAIRTETGELDYIPDWKGDHLFHHKILVAMNDYFKYEQYIYQPSFAGIYPGSLNYYVHNDNLYFSKYQEFGTFRGKYKRTKIGEILNDPIISKFNLFLDSDGFNKYLLKNDPVENAPRVYAHINNKDLHIKGSLNNFFVTITIKIKDFNGIGRYDENSVHISYGELYDDLMFEYSSEYQSFKIDLQIDSYIPGKTISGKLNFSIFEFINDNYTLLKKLTDGEFELPVY